MKYSLICLMTALIWTGSATIAGARSGEVADQVQSMRNELTVLNSPVRESNRSYRDLVLVELPNLIESLALQHRFREAKELAQLKLSTGIRLFGAQSVTTLDALQDLLFLAVQQHDETERNAYLKQYAQLTLEMKRSHNDDLVDTANEIRGHRLQRKLEAAEAILRGNM
jgi:hypothetical protein